MGILRRKMGSWSLSSSLITSAVHIILVIVRIIMGGGGRYKNKKVESNLRKPVRQLITSQYFWFV
jgi:hypothetical protein